MSLADEIAAQSVMLADMKLKLAALLVQACPGPHRFVQHRDHKPPWCNACGYAEDGRKP